MEREERPDVSQFQIKSRACSMRRRVCWLKSCVERPPSAMRAVGTTSPAARISTGALLLCAGKKWNVSSRQKDRRRRAGKYAGGTFMRQGKEGRACCRQPGPPTSWNIFSLKCFAFQTIRLVVSRKKRGFSVYFGPGGAVPPPRVSPFSKVKRSKTGKEGPRPFFPRNFIKPEDGS